MNGTISTVIATHNSEQLLVPTLAALVSGALIGLVGEVIIVDNGSTDATYKIADEAGCKFMSAPGSLGQRLKQAAAEARGTWLMFLTPGTVPDAIWTDEASRFMQETEMAGTAASRAAVFRRAPAVGSRDAILREALALLAMGFGAPPRPRQGLLIARSLYDRLGGHCIECAETEQDLLRRIGRRHIVTLRSAALSLKPVKYS